LTKNYPIKSLLISSLKRYNQSKRTGFSQKRFDKADLNYPVIVTNNGEVIDGRHRILKAIGKGLKYVKAVIVSN